MKYFFLALCLLLGVPVWGDDAKETPEQTQASIAQTTSDIDALAKKVPVDVGGDWDAVQASAARLVTLYSTRATFYIRLKEYDKAQWDYFMADDARRKLFSDKYKAYIETEADLSIERAYCLMSMDNLDKALRCADDAKISKGWEHHRASNDVLLVLVYLKCNKADEALEAALDLEKHVPDDASVNVSDAYGALCQSYLLKGNYEQATANWNALTKDDPGFAQVKFLKPELARLNGAIAKDPKNAGAWFIRGSYYLNMGDKYNDKVATSKDEGMWMATTKNMHSFASHPIYFWDAAQRDFARSYALQRDPRALVQRAMALYYISLQKEEIKSNILPPNSTWQQNARDALKTGYGDLSAMNNLYILQGTVALNAPENSSQQRAAQFDANFAYSLAVLHHPDDNLSAISRAEISRNADRLIESTGELTPSTVTKTAKEWKELGNAEKKNGHLGAALACYKKALEVDPQYGDAYNNIGLLYGGVGDYPRALDNLRSAIKVNPQHAIARINLAAHLYTLHFYKEALEASNEAVRVATTPVAKGASLETRASVFVELKDNAKAMDDLQAATSLNPKSASAWKMLGMIALIQIDMSTARDAFEKSLAAEPTDAFTKVLSAMAISEADLEQTAKNRGVEVQELPYSDWETIPPGARVLLDNTKLSSSEKDELLDFWNERVIVATPNTHTPVKTRCLSILRAALDVKSPTFQGTRQAA